METPRYWETVMVNDFCKYMVAYEKFITPIIGSVDGVPTDFSEIDLYTINPEYLYSIHTRLRPGIAYFIMEQKPLGEIIDGRYYKPYTVRSCHIYLNTSLVPHFRCWGTKRKNTNACRFCDNQVSIPWPIQNYVNNHVDNHKASKQILSGVLGYVIENPAPGKKRFVLPTEILHFIVSFL